MAAVPSAHAALIRVDAFAQFRTVNEVFFDAYK
jgi:hypothetical protein